MPRERGDTMRADDRGDIFSPDVAALMLDSETAPPDVVELLARGDENDVPLVLCARGL